MTRRKLAAWLCFAVVAVTLVGATSERTIAKPKIQTAKIEITTKGYEPANFKLRRGVKARVTFLRTTDATCVKEIVLPDFGIRRALPLNQPVVVTFTPIRKGSFTFVCGMNMMSGQMIVQ